MLNQKQVRRPLCCNLLESFPCQFGIHANYAAREKFREGDCVLTADLRVQEAAIIELRQTGKATYLRPLKEVSQRGYFCRTSAGVEIPKPAHTGTGIIQGRLQERGSLRTKLNL
jgi:hypothetical protein